VKRQLQARMGTFSEVNGVLRLIDVDAGQYRISDMELDVNGRL